MKGLLPFLTTTLVGGVLDYGITAMQVAGAAREFNPLLAAVNKTMR